MPILYVNGDSHAAAAEAVNPHAFAEDDGRYFYMGRAPHPENLSVSWGRLLAERIKYTFKCDAESASSNARVLRTTRKYIENMDSHPSNVLVIVQWSTWERQEWLIDGTYYQITSSGIDDVPEEHQDRYRDYVINVDWKQATEKAHRDIWQLHLDLESRNIRHIFFNGNNHFNSIADLDRQDWGTTYVSPYDPEMTWDQWLRRNGHDTVSPKSWHFGRDAHAAWSRFMLQYIVQNQLI